MGAQKNQVSNSYEHSLKSGTLHSNKYLPLNKLRKILRHKRAEKFKTESECIILLNKSFQTSLVKPVPEVKSGGTGGEESL